MTIEIRLAQFGMGMQEAKILRWLKTEGEHVRAGEVILEAESEKAAIEIEAPVSGVLARITAKADEVVPVGELLGEIAADGAPIVLTALRPTSIPSASMSESLPMLVKTDSGAPPAMQCEPRARRLAQEAGIELVKVSGTGPQGRIMEHDVRRAIETAAAGGNEVIPIRGIRAAIARSMSESLQNMAQLTLHSEADVTLLCGRRNALSKDQSASVTELLVRAATIALQQHPQVNATLEDGEIRIHKRIGIGVATHGDKGLFVPVLHDAASLTLRKVSDQLRALVAQVRRGAAKAADLSGGSFTITNLGQFGIDGFTPIIQPPQIAILGVGRIAGRYVRGSEGPVWREYMTLSLTFDHRALDGVPAAKFLKTVVDHLESPDSLFG